MGARWVRLGELPTFTVVVASTGGRERLNRCLHTLAPQCEAENVELVVVRSADDAELMSLSAAWPEIRFVGVDEGASVPMLRMAGAREASGDIVVLQEDEAVPPDWIAQHARWNRAAAPRTAPSDKGVSE